MIQLKQIRYGFYMNGTKYENNVPAVNRAINVIEFVSLAQQGTSFNEIKDSLGIPRQSLIRLLNTLCNRGFLEKSTNNSNFRLGPQLLYLGHGLHDKFKLRNTSMKYMKELSQRTRKTIELSSLDRDQLIVLEQIPGKEEMSIYSRVGSVIPYLHAVSVGKVYLALMDPGKRQRVLKKIGLPKVRKNTITNMKNLEKEIRETLKRGYGFEDQELRDGVRRVAAPIFNPEGEHVGCIGLAATIFSFDLEDIDKFGQMSLDVAQKISEELGYKQNNF